MQKTKKWLSILVAAMLMCSLTACASSEDVVQLASEVEEATSEETEDTTSEVASADEKEDTSKKEETKTETPDKSDTGTNSAKDLLAKGETNTSDTKEDASTSAKDVTKTTEKAKETTSTDTKNKENNVVTEKNTQTTTTTTKTEEAKPVENKNTQTTTTQQTTNTTTPVEEKTTESNTQTPTETPSTSGSSSSSSSNTTTNKYCAENGHYYNQSEGEWKERIENLSGGCYRVWRYRNLMCGECGNILPDADEEVVDEVHTKIVTMEGKKATCTDNGYSEGISCGCGYYSQAGGTVLPATGHNYGPVRRTGNILSYNEETGEVVLETAQTCGRCGDKIYGEEIDYQQ